MLAFLLNIELSYSEYELANHTATTTATTLTFRSMPFGWNLTTSFVLL